MSNKSSVPTIELDLDLKANEDATKIGPSVQQEERKIKSSGLDPSAEPPDGGLLAWSKVFGCFLLYSNIWGFTIAFGTFQAYFQHDLLKTSSPSAISWIGTVQSWLLILIGCLSGPLFDLGYFRSMMILGNFGVVFGIFMLSLSKNYWQIFLSQGVCMGIGAGLLYVPSVALLGLSFSSKRSVAQGIVTSGIAVGGIAYILAFDRLTTSKGFGWAVRTLGFLSLGISIIALPALLYGTKKLREPRTARKLYDSSAFKDRKFLIYTTCSFVTFLGYITPYFYVASFGQDVLGLSKDQANNILLGAISASFFGRISVGIVAHKFGSILTWLWCAAISGVIALTWVAVDTKAGLICFAVFWGFCSGGLVTLPAAVFPGLCPSPKILGTRLGMSLGISSFASLIGSPIAGALLRHSKPNDGSSNRFMYLGPQLWSGACLLLGAAIILVLYRVAHTKQRPEDDRTESP